MDIQLIDWTLRLTNLAYIAAAILFILALVGLSAQTSAKRGNLFGAAGMLVALVATIARALVNSHADPVHFNGPIVTFILIALAMGIGAAVGIVLSRKVEMTGMPELIAMLHSFVGLSAVLIGFNSFLHPHGISPAMETFHLGEVALGIFIGAVTFTGSIVAYLKLSAKIKGAPLMLPGRNWINLGVLVFSLVLGIVFMASGGEGFAGWASIILLTLLALFLGFHLVAAIGGGDMPVVVSMLNSYSGWAAAAAGFVGLLSLANMGGRFIWSSASDVIGRKNMYMVYLGVGLIFYFVLASAGHTSLGLFVACALVLLTFYGGGFSTIPAYLRDLFGVYQVGAIHGRLLTAWSAAGVAGPLIINMVVERQASRGNEGPELYQLSLYIMCVLLAVGLVANFLVKPVDRKWFEAPHTVQAKVEADRAAAAGADAGASAKASRAHTAVAIVLALVIAALLVYGLWETAVKASGMFVG